LLNDVENYVRVKLWPKRGEAFYDASAGSSLTMMEMQGMQQNDEYDSQEESSDEDSDDDEHVMYRSRARPRGSTSRSRGAAPDAAPRYVPPPRRPVFSSEPPSIAYLHRLLKCYHARATACYAADPVLRGQMMLTVYALLALLDSAAGQEVPMLLEHRTGVNPAMLSALLLPGKADLTLLMEIEDYFEGRNEAAMHRTSLLMAASEPSATSVSVRYAQDKLQDEKERITDMAQEMVEDTRGKIARAKQKYEEAVAGYEKKHCRGQGEGVKNGDHRRDCDRCDKVYKSQSIKVLKYEYLLPGLSYPFDAADADANAQDAFIFEFHAPFALAAARDAIFFVLSNMAAPVEDAKAVADPNTFALLVKTKLFLERSAQNPYLSSEHRSLICPLRMTMAGKKKGTKAEGTKNVMLYKGAGESAFYLPCTVSSGAFRAPVLTEDPRAQMQWCSSFAVDAAYAPMQRFIESTRHTENEVLASQSDCPDGIALSEFRCFGALRRSATTLVSNSSTHI
jgi:hypothetical protein